jgi:hypothetical protein
MFGTFIVSAHFLGPRATEETGNKNLPWSCAIYSSSSQIENFASSFENACDNLARTV